MLLASTGQTPHGFVQASFGGPLGVLSAPEPVNQDVVRIGDGGAADATELAALLQTAGREGAVPAAPFQVTYAPGAMPNTSGISALAATGPASAPVAKQSDALTLKPVLNSEGRVDCTGAVSCVTDPVTNMTTVTFPDGVVAIVQQINNMTLVAYKTVTDTVAGAIQGLIPKFVQPKPAATVPAPKPPAVPAAPAAPEPEIVAAPPVTVQVPDVDAGPLAPVKAAPKAPIDISASTIRPQLTITRAPEDFSATNPGGPTIGNPEVAVTDAIDAVKGAVGSVVGAVTDAVGKALGPAAATEVGPNTSDARESSTPAE